MIARVRQWLRRVSCGLHGHDRLLAFTTDRVYLKCVSCGSETPGWTVLGKGRHAD